MTTGGQDCLLFSHRFNERPTVVVNATFMFFVHSLSDAFVLVAASVSLEDVVEGGGSATASVLCTLCIIFAALVEGGQLPFIDLLARSMEQPSPTSALGEATLSGHAGVVLLGLTQEIWDKSSWTGPPARGGAPLGEHDDTTGLFRLLDGSPRCFLGVWGGISAIAAGLVAHVRPDRKGSLGFAAAATVGLLYVVCAVGYTDLALLMAFGHAVFRSHQLCCNKVKLSPWKVSTIHANTPSLLSSSPPPLPHLPPSHPSLPP